ncbi:low temperature requirement protein A [Staphylococcus equorum]|uniref:low temperature requirement protein A n=1 Tax=Staphylococcus equorum TaxID=246432 RepID=UPI003CF63FB4
MNKKEVSMSELFFDLIFVSILSQVNQATEHMEDGILSTENLFKNFMLFLIFVAIWVYRTLLVNRFFNKKWYQYAFVFIDMFLIILLSRAIDSDFQSTFTPGVIITILIFLSIATQYILNYVINKDKFDIRLILPYVISLIVASLVSFFSLFINNNSNVLVFLIAVTIASIVPLFFPKQSKRHPVYFDHLSERLSLFVILMFGEGLIFIVSDISVFSLNPVYIIMFVLLVLLFILYALHYKYTEKENVKRTGFFTLYMHLLILYFIDIMFLIINEEMQYNSFSSFNFHYLYIIAFIMYLIMLLANTKHYSSILNSSKIKMNIIALVICVVLSSILNSFILINIVFILTILVVIFINYKDKIRKEFI